MRERAEKLGGSVWIESAPGRGAIVFVRVPLAPNTATDSHYEEEDSPAHRR
jgi:signal transduction histidine kinase